VIRPLLFFQDKMDPLDFRLGKRLGDLGEKI
jgi:hypothetical protein